MQGKVIKAVHKIAISITPLMLLAILIFPLTSKAANFEEPFADVWRCYVNQDNQYSYLYISGGQDSIEPYNVKEIHWQSQDGNYSVTLNQQNGIDTWTKSGGTFIFEDNCDGYTFDLLGGEGSGSTGITEEMWIIINELERQNLLVSGIFLSLSIFMIGFILIR